MKEFDFIDQLLTPLATDPAALGLGDDAAILAAGCGSLVVTKDMLIEGVHFHANDPPASIARKSLRVNLSDIAAMGAHPRGYFLGCAWGGAWRDSDLEAFVAGLAEDQAEFGLALLGGDTTAHDGATIVSITMIGEAADSAFLPRGGAVAGDDLYVSGTLGDGWLGLQALVGGRNFGGLSDAERDHVIDRYRLPQPRVALGRELCGVAHAAIDISDGLIADAGHLGRRSNCGLEIALDATPLSDAARKWAGDGVETEKNLLTLARGGDDYELLFAAPPEKRDAVAAAARSSGVSVTRIGRVFHGAGVRVLNESGDALETPFGGYEHMTSGGS
ncbi:MAG: thiamine-phosphate kinase [Parvularculaceae bacterium]